MEDFEEIEGNLNKDKADFIKDWKDKHPDPKPNDPPTPPAPPSNDDKFDKLMKKFEELEKREAEREKSEKIAKLRKELKAKLKKEGVEDAEWLDGYLKKLTITEETDIDEEKEDALKLYNKANSTTNQFTPGNPAGKGGEVDLSYLKKGKK